MLITMVASLICLGYPSNPVSASDFTGAYEFKLTAGDGAADDYFGYSVAISGDTAVVGAYWDDVGANASQGSAYVFTRSGTTWTEQAQLTASDGAATDHFGCSVAINGDTAVVGAYSDDVGATPSQGSAYVFTRSGTNWTEQAQLTASDGAASDYFGLSVAISGDTAVVGAYMDDVGANSTDQGSAYVFTRSGSTWTQQTDLTAGDGAADDHFGYSVAVSGDTAVVGARWANSTQGSAYVFTRSGTVWTEQAQLTASDGTAGDHFGHSVAMSGDTAVVGARWDDIGANPNQGSAYVFTRSGTVWTEQAQLTAGDGAAGDMFGCSVAISADIAVVGAYWNDVGANADQGSAYVYDGRDRAAQVSATVTLQGYLISVVISEGYPTAVEYGVMLPNTEAVPTAYIPDTYSYLRVENNGNVAEDVLIKGANATCVTGTWILAATPGADQYSHLYGVGQTPGSYSTLDTLAKNLSNNVTVGGTVDFNVKIQTPTNSTVYGQYSTTVTVLAVAT
jgi:glutamate synthase domain-containing protein 3